MSVRYYSGGGANSIGKSFSLLVFDGKYHLGMDWGGGYENIYSEPRYNGPLNCLFVSHAHLDHCIQVPRLKRKYEDKVRLFATLPTAELCEVGWKQTLHLADENKMLPPFSELDIEKTRQSVEIIEADKEIKLTNEISVFPLNSGHILGSVYLLVVYKGETYFLTSDICFQDRHLIKGATMLSLEKSRLLVRESTYINKPFEDRQQTIDRFLASTKEVLGNGGRVLVPALSIDRTQDIFAIASEAGISPIYIDGSRQATEVYARHLGAAAESLKNAVKFENNSHRRDFIDSGKPALIIASSGMIHPGTLSSFWSRNLAPNQGDAVFLVNYQDPEGQGAKLLATEKGKFLVLNGGIVKRDCRIERFNFSAHMSGEDGRLLEGRLNPDVVIYNHGQDSEIDKYIANAPKDRRRIKAMAGRYLEV
jgi:Cft2 family RNA processing exonuclease